jgi:hypothetical protein
MDRYFKGRSPQATSARLNAGEPATNVRRIIRVPAASQHSRAPSLVRAAPRLARGEGRLRAERDGRPRLGVELVPVDELLHQRTRNTLDPAADAVTS